MGQQITVVEKPSRQPSVVRYETNRTLSGMGHETYRLGQQVDGVRPTDELARRLLARGGVEAVHVFSNVITVEFGYGGDPGGVADIIRDLFTYYTPGVTPPTDEELTGSS